MIFPALSIELRPLLTELEEASCGLAAASSDEGGLLLPLERDCAKMVHFLLTSTNRRRLLEIGTGTGYATLWLAAAARATHGRPVVTIERDHARLEQARSNLLRAALSDWVEPVEADATTALQTVVGPFDAVLFDADPVTAPEQLALLLPKLADDVLLLTGNALAPGGGLGAYVTAVEALPGITCFTIPLGRGLHVAHRR